MQALGGTELPTSTTVHTLNLSGTVVTLPKKSNVLARCRMTFAGKDEGVTMELTARGQTEEAVQLIMGAIA